MTPDRRNPDDVKVTVWMHRDLKARVLAKLAEGRSGETMSSLIRRYLERWAK